MYKIINYCKQKNKTFLLGLLLFLVGVAQLKAQTTPLLTESFNYPNSTVLTSANWSNVASAGTNNVTAYSGNLTYPGTIGNTIGNKATLTDNGQDVSRSFTSTNVTTSVPMYVSMVVNVSDAKTGDYFFMLGGVPVYIRTNGSGGFNFGINKTNSALTVQYESTARTLNQNYLLVLKYEVVSGTTNDVVKLFVNPSLSTEPSTADVSYTLTGATAGTDVTSFSSLSLYQGTALTSPKLDIDGINVGTTWASVTSAAYDYGDLPVSYDQPAGTLVAARQMQSNTLILGTTVDVEGAPQSVSTGADNNGNNGDGIDEDGINPIANPITPGTAYALPVSVINTTGSAKTLYGWIDLNNNGVFEVGEVQTISVANNATTATLTWPSTSTANVTVGSTPYLRLRMSSATLTDNATTTAYDERAIGDGLSTGAYGTAPGIGEIEDYRVVVNPAYDYGDVPVSYDQPAGTLVAARQLSSNTLRLGATVDIENNVQSVATGTDNNGTNGDGLDEDAIANPSGNTITPNTAYSLNIPLTNTTGSPQTLYGWVDFNGNGTFESGEVATANVANNATTATLTWPSTVTVNAIGSQTYVRLRISSVALSDNTGTTYDERSIGDGLNTGAYGTNPGIGEIEDYRVAINPAYDFGDVPASYDKPSGIFVAARQLPSAALKLGATTPDIETNVQSVADGADNNGSNGDGLDEDGINPASYTITPASAFTLPVALTNTSGSAKTLYGWIDLNNNGVFESGEITSVSVANNATTANLSWTAAQTGSIVSSNVYVRLRMSSATLADNASTTYYDERAIGDGLSIGAYGTTPATGEIEDYRLAVNAVFDFGDAPNTFEFNDAITIVPARHLPTSTLYLGSTYDVETTKNAVAAGADNGGTNGDGADEDGITGTLPLLNSNTTTYSVNVNVYKTVAGTATLHGWIDMDGDGRFSSSEYTSATVTGTTGAQTVVLTWSSPYYFDTGATTSYMRLRFTTATLTDNTSTTLVDERSIGDGLTTGLYTTATAYPNGEIEDYPVPLPAPVVIDPNLDSDGDGVKDVNDLDADNDGIPDSIEGPVSLNDSSFKLYNAINYQGTTAYNWSLYITGAAGTTVTYTPYGGSATTATIPSTGNLVVKLTSSQLPNWPLNQVTSGKYVSVSSSAPISIIQEILGDAGAADAAVVYPPSVWGTKYTVASYYNTSGSINDRGLTIFSASDNNVVLVKNKAGTSVAFFTLNSGQNYIYAPGQDVDVSGYTITSSKNVGVMTAVRCANSPGSACDNTLEFLLPDRLLGTKFLTRSPANTGRMQITATKNNTVVKIDGVAATVLANTGDTYVYTQAIGSSQIIETNNPVQFTKIVPYDYDPAITTIQDVTKATLGPAIFTIPSSMTTSNQLSIFVKTADTDKMLYNGSAISGWASFSYDPSYSYVTLSSMTAGSLVTVSSTTGSVPFLTDWYGIGYRISDATPLSIGGVSITSGSTSANSYKDTDGDGIPDYLDLDSDNDGCLDALEGSASITSSQLVNAGGTVTVGTGSTASNRNLCAGNSCVNSQGIPQFASPPSGYSNTTGQGVGTSIDPLIQDAVCLVPPFCYKPAATGGTTLDTKHGITALGRAGSQDTDNWPMVRKGAWTALEAKTKGFVANRLTATQIAAIPAADLIEGMMVYDTTNNCLKIYTTTDGTTFSWQCMNTQTCPDN